MPIRITLLFAILSVTTGCFLLRPRPTESPYQRGRTHYSHDRLEQADAALAEVGPEDPDYPQALSMRSKIAMKQGRIANAHGLLNTLSTSYPDAFDEYDQRRYDEAFSALVVTREFAVPGQVRHIAADPGLLGVLTADGKVFSVTAIDLRSGRPAWSHRLGSGASQRLNEIVAVAGGRVFAIDGTGSRGAGDLLALDGASGQEVWRHSIGTVRNGTRFAVAGDGVAIPVDRQIRVDGDKRHELGLELIDTDTAAVRWRADLDAPIASLCVMNERVYSRDQHGVLRSHDLRNGTELWTLGFAPEVKSNEELVCNEGLLWLVTSDGRVHAFDAGDEGVDPPLARIRWSADAGSVATVAAGETTVYLPVPNEVALLDIRDGHVLSKIEHGVRDRVSSYALPPARAHVVADQDVVLLGYRTAMLAVDRAGQVQWRLAGRPLSATPLAVADGHVYAGTTDTGTDSAPAVIEIPLHPDLPY